MSQSWTPSLKIHRHYENVNLNLDDFCFWSLHGLWLNTNDTTNLTQFDYSKAPEYKKPEDKKCLHDLAAISPSLIKGELKSENFEYGH